MQNKAQCITFYFDNLNITNMKMHLEIQCAKEGNLVDMEVSLMNFIVGNGCAKGI
jgi:hypothetical protein